MADPLVGEDFLAAVAAYTQAVADAVHTAADRASAHVQESLAREAQASTRWADIAQDIQVYANDGRYWVGVQSPGAVSEAMSAEYGDATHPPVPLIRAGEVRYNREAADIMEEHLQPVLGAV